MQNQWFATFSYFLDTYNWTHLCIFGNIVEWDLFLFYRTRFIIITFFYQFFLGLEIEFKNFCKILFWKDGLEGIPARETFHDFLRKKIVQQKLHRKIDTENFYMWIFYTEFLCTENIFYTQTSYTENILHEKYCTKKKHYSQKHWKQKNFLHHKIYAQKEKM